MGNIEMKIGKKYPLGLEQHLEVTTKKRIVEEKLNNALIGSHLNMSNKVMKRHNSCFLTLCFNPQSSKEEMLTQYNGFWSKVYQLSGIKRKKCATFGWLFSRGDKFRYFPHAHVVCYSVKSFNGATIANLSRSVRNKLQAYWKEVVQFNTWKLPEDKHPMFWERIYDFKGLVKYLTGWSNMDRRGSSYAQHFMPLPTHNEQLLMRKLKGVNNG